RDNLGTLSLAIKNGELYGRSLANRAYSTVAAVDGRTGLATDNTGGEPAQVAQQRPLVVIRFDRKDVDYEQALYTAVSRALERRPNATF
ncbi:MAG: hypothetical protein GWM93_14615, partial [Gemmatimonadetes bacterium]|nr:hypothetical protein [Gemmatimonadota bacterium]NIT67889.1 hypothetical protein [Gemmatimonadota bacterium]NIY36466.1 hypothetical protein [Gemmatimonadota bacterium]NIY45619.1 hypothetical protein [Gemmatimonadota bacterium]